MTPLRLRTWLTLIYSGMIAVLLTLVAAAYHALLVRQVDRDARVALAETVRGLHGFLEFRDGRPTLSYDRADLEAAAFVDDATRYYQVYDASGHLLVQSPGFAAAGVDYTPDEVKRFFAERGEQDVETDRGRLRISSSVVGSGSQVYLLQVGLTLERVDRSIAGLERTLLWASGIAILAAALIGRWMSGRALAPLSRLAEATRDIDIDTLSQRLPLRGAGDELDAVTTAFNQALDRVEHAVEEMRQFSAALAHELRTPLAILRGETELALTTPSSPAEHQARLASQIEEIDRLNALITQILTLARAEAGQIALVRVPVDLSQIAADTVEQLESVANARGIALACETTQPAVVSGDPGWLARLLLILLDNAIAFTPAGGRIRVHARMEPGAARLAVSDTGAGIVADAIPHVFERFYRADAARPHDRGGAGLGLSLAKWIVDQHHGTIEVSSQPGQGSTFTVRLPA